MIKTEVDPGNVLAREFTDLERKNLPFATLQAVNATAFETREEWKRRMPRVFDRPTSLTMNAVLYNKATKQTLTSEVFVRDEAFKGTPPAKYLQAQVQGGSRRLKSFEQRLRDAGHLPAGMFAVPGRGAPLDAHGNVPTRLINRILSQLGAQRDELANETEKSRKRRKRRGGHDVFAVKRKRGNLLPGVYQRRAMAAGDSARRAIGASSRIDSILIFVNKVAYRPIYDIFGMAQRIYTSVFPFHFERELSKAMETSKYRGRS